jgi:hypothetical protein
MSPLSEWLLYRCSAVKLIARVTPLRTCRKARKGLLCTNIVVVVLCMCLGTRTLLDVTSKAILSLDTCSHAAKPALSRSCQDYSSVPIMDHVWIPREEEYPLRCLDWNLSLWFAFLVDISGSLFFLFCRLLAKLSDFCAQPRLMKHRRMKEMRSLWFYGCCKRGKVVCSLLVR